MGVSLLSIIVTKLGFDFNYVLWGNIGGYSLVTNVLFIYIFYSGNYCILTRLMSLGLLISNIVNIIGEFYPKYYNIWYDLIICVIIISSWIVYELYKKFLK